MIWIVDGSLKMHELILQAITNKHEQYVHSEIRRKLLAVCIIQIFQAREVFTQYVISI